MRKLWSKASMVVKQSIMCILLVTISLGITVACTSVLLSQHLEQSLQERAEETVSNLSLSLNDCFDEFHRFTVLPLYDMTLQETLMQYAAPDSPDTISYSDQLIIGNFFAEQYYDNQYIKRATLYVMNGTYLSSDASIGRWNMASLSWVPGCRENPYHTFIFTEGKTLAFRRALQNPLNPGIMAYISVELTDNAIDNILDAYALPSNCEVMIHNDQDVYLYPYDFQGEPDSVQNTDAFLYSSIVSPDTGLTTTVKFSTQGIQDKLAVLHKQVLFIAGIALLLSWVSSYYLSKTLTQPIKNLKQKMELVGEGQLDTRMTVESHDEIGQLEAMFNQMMEKLEALITDFYEVSLASRDAQISALQSQINPHFLYNTLETINMMAIVDGKFEISDAVSNLGRMMHYCVANEQHFATLEEELQFVTAYYDIQRLRIGELHSLTILADEQCRRQLVPKLLLQPFVENIVQHGIGETDLDIILDVSVDEKDLTICVENNGLPLTPEARTRLTERLRGAERQSSPSQTANGKGYGLVNVHTRLRLLYGNGYGVSLDETKTDGVKFIIKLKRRTERNHVPGNDR